jgi:hypothetical protein
MIEATHDHYTAREIWEGRLAVQAQADDPRRRARQ